MNDKYEIKRIEGTELYRVACDGVEIADGVTFRTAVAMVENTMYCGRTDCHSGKAASQ